jgi:PAS domain S-box-containing protein
VGGSGSGFRVVEKRGPLVEGDPAVVLFRLDPATLDISEASGDPERLLGFPPEEWYRPQFWSGRIHPEDRAAARAFFGRWAEAPCDVRLEYRVIDAAGRTIWVRQVIAIGRDARQEEAIRGVFIDISERIAGAAAVEKALFLKTELFRIIAEKLAPPVRAISVFGEMLERHLAAQRDDVGSDYAVGLREELERLDTMLGQLMRIAQGGMPIEEMNAALAAIRGGGRPGER